jgi:hypothetical protein
MGMCPELVEIIHESYVAIYRNHQLAINRTTPNNKPEIIIRDNKKGTYILIYAAISGDRNVI